MVKSTVRSSFHPESPKRLRHAYAKAGSFQRLADQIGVNVSHVFKALRYCVKPSNPKIAAHLFFDGKPLRLGDGRHRHIRWWRRLSAQQRNQLIHFLYHYKENE